MAKMNFKGFQVVSEEFLRLEREAPEAIDRMLTESADILIREQKASIEKHKLVDTGALRDSIKATPIRRTGISANLQVYPQGKDKKGVENAEKGFIHEYGTSKIKGKRWMSKASKIADPLIEAKQAEIWEEVNGGGSQ